MLVAGRQAQPGQLDLRGDRARVEPQHLVVRLDGIGHFPAAVVDDGQGEMRGRRLRVGRNGGLGALERLVQLVFRRQPLRLHDEHRRVFRHARQHGVEPLVRFRHAAFGVVQRGKPRLGLGKRRRIRRERGQQARGILGTADAHVVVSQLKTGRRRLRDVGDDLERLLRLLGATGGEIQHGRACGWPAGAAAPWRAPP